jgi:hypothetical protein
MVGSERVTAMSLASHPPALHLVPPLGRFGVLEWREYEALYQAGYTFAKRELDAGKLSRPLWEGQMEDIAA